MFCQILEIPGTLVNHFLLDFIVSMLYGNNSYIIFSILSNFSNLIFFKKKGGK